MASVKSSKRTKQQQAIAFVITMVARLLATCCSGPRLCYAWSSSSSSWSWPACTSSSRHYLSSAFRLFSSNEYVSPLPPEGWKGTTSHSTSDFVTHVVVGDDSPSVSEAISSVLSLDRPQQQHDKNLTTKEEENVSLTHDGIPLDNAVLMPHHYLQLGAVWFLPATDARRNPSDGIKPIRLGMSDLDSTLDDGDYLRIHHTPRRFPVVYKYNWMSTSEEQQQREDQDSSSTSSNDDDDDDEIIKKPSVVVACDDERGYLVINKPCHVPVHPTVDNAIENVAYQIRCARRLRHRCSGSALRQNDNDNVDNGVYVSTPQRLDQNTSGLLVVATKRTFAAYFAQLLRKKTDAQLLSSSSSDSNSTTTTTISDAVHKRYKCLVCLIAPPATGANSRESDNGVPTQPPWSVATAMNRLRAFVNKNDDEQPHNGVIMKHYLEPSIRAPKKFAAAPGNDTWAECLLRLTNVGDVCPLVGSEGGRELASALWNKKDGIPPNCAAVVEVEVELLTGRTHQIRGQLATEGFPLVGDAQYGGAIPAEREGVPNSTHYIHSEELALQCSQLEFLDPNVVVRPDGTEVMVPSKRWNKFRLDESWWTPLIQRYRASSANDRTTSLQDLIEALKMQAAAAAEESKVSPAEVFPPNVMLSPGAHKYILIRAMHPSDGEERWFVKSASPSECGGPYHANVAQNLVDWLEAAGFTSIVVTGGGRIDYNRDTKEARVFGFSYGFGKAAGSHRVTRRVRILSDSMSTVNVENNSSTKWGSEQIIQGLAHVGLFSHLTKWQRGRRVGKHLLFAVNIHMVESFRIAESRAETIDAQTGAPFQCKRPCQPLECTICHCQWCAIETCSTEAATLCA